MRLFKKPHIHSFTTNYKEVYESAFNQIIVEHKKKAKITRVCPCGATQEREVQIGFQLL